MQQSVTIDYKLLYEQTLLENAQQQKQIEKLQLQVQSLHLQLREIKKIVFGSKGEKFVPQSKTKDTAVQQDLFPNDKLGELELAKTIKIAGYEVHKSKVVVKQPQTGKHPGRNPLPEHLRREVVELQPTEDVQGLQPIRKEITEVLEYQPGELFVKQFIRAEYIKPTEDGLNAKRIIAPLPNQPLERSMAGASLLTHLLVSKFVDHLPLYRQTEIFKRQGVEVKYNTLSGWIRGALGLIEPLYNLHCKTVLKANYLSVDETTIKVLDKDKKETPHKGFYWVYYDPSQKLALFDYQPGRGALYPKAMLHNFSGYLQSDGYDVYESFDNVEGITTLCCWAHARRKFIEAKDYDKVNAESILTHIQELYAIEAHCRTLKYSPEQRMLHRQQHAVPILNKLHRLLEQLLKTYKVLPSSPLGRAIAYSLKRWKKLCVYTSDGVLEIDNNLIENSIRPIALGRKNYLFAGNHDRAQDAAMIYSLFATCSLHGINPEQWLSYVLTNIKSTPKELLHLLLPQNYKANFG